MNLSTVWRTIYQNCCQVMTKFPIQQQNKTVLTRSLHYVCSNKSFITSEKVIPRDIQSSGLLKVSVPSIIQNCGFKVKVKLKRRCKDCYFVMRDERLYVLCKSKPRHKQMIVRPKEKNTWILTHATQGPRREW